MKGKDYYQGNTVDNFIHDMGMSFREGCVVKYVSRYKSKNGLEDLLKARDYLNRIIDSYTESEKYNDRPF